ncbi:hypothetical protein GCM10009557_92290 [Virgisporangium ochraceum]|uniref:Uncharacterized protein n=1 Tax=Virgisporangium ochraceum TaxID=65505 RepID=A0A8J4E9L0_9ACTN|nr:hypothetical protein Voc01_022770 [Virgisporangium ochraceum]
MGRPSVDVVTDRRARRRHLPVVHPSGETGARGPERDERAPADWRPVTTRPAPEAHDPGT